MKICSCILFQILGILPFRFMFNLSEIIIFVFNMNKRSNFTFFLWIANCVNFIENSTVSPLDEIPPLLSVLSTYVWVLSRLSILSAAVVSNSVPPHRWQPTRLPHPWDSPGKNTGVGCHFLLQCMKVKSESEATQSCPTLSDPMDCSLPGFTVHGIFQARVLEWGAIAFSALFYLLVYNITLLFFLALWSVLMSGKTSLPTILSLTGFWLYSF